MQLIHFLPKSLSERVSSAGWQSGFAGESCNFGGIPAAAGQPGGKAAGRSQEAYGEQLEAEHCSQNPAAGLAKGGQAAPAGWPLGDRAGCQQKVICLGHMAVHACASVTA